MAKNAEERGDGYNQEKDTDIVRDDGGVRKAALPVEFKAGSSRRIWGELYKVDIYMMTAC